MMNLTNEEYIEHSKDKEIDRLRVSNDMLRAENAKLREQLRNVYVAHRYGLDCTECPWYDECDTEGGCPWLGILRDHLRKLGIETD